MGGHAQQGSRERSVSSEEKGQVQQGSGEGSGEGLGGFGAQPGQVHQGSREGSGVQSQVRFNRRLRRRSGKLWCRARSGLTGCRKSFQRRSGRLWCRARSSSTGFQRRFQRAESGPVQQGSGEGSGEGVGGFGAEPTGFRKRFRRRSGRLRCKARSSSTVFLRRFGKRCGRLWCQVRLNRGPEKDPEKVLGRFGAERGQVQRGSGEGSGEGLEGLVQS